MTPKIKIKLLLLCILFFYSSFALRGEEVTPIPSQNSLSLRYWMVPADKMEVWPWGDQKYFPIRGELFQHRIDLLEARQKEESGEAPANPLYAVRLVGRLEGKTLTGTGTIFFRSSVSSNEKTSFPPISFATSGHRWNDDRPAAVTYFPNLQFVIDSPIGDQLFFRWSKQCRTDSRGNLVADFVLPQSPQLELAIEIPNELTPITSEAVIQEQQIDSSGNKRYIFHPGGNKQMKISFPPMTEHITTSQKNDYQQEMNWHVTQEGITATSRFTFNHLELPINQLTLLLDSPLEPLAIEWEGTGSPATIVSSQNGPEQTSLVLQWSPGNIGAVLKVTAIAAMKDDFADRLPRIRIESNKIVWKETLCRLRVTPPVFVSKIDDADIVQIFDPLLSTNSGNQSYLFKYLKEDSQVIVSCKESLAEVQFDSVTNLLLVPEQWSVQTFLKYKIENGLSANLRLPLRPGWEIDSITTGSGELVYWENDPLSPESFVQISLLGGHTKPGDEGEELIGTLLLQSRYTPGEKQSFLIDELTPIIYQNIATGKHFLRPGTEPPFRVETLNWDNTLFETSTLVSNEPLLREFATSPFLGATIPLGNETVGAKIHLQKMTPECSAKVIGQIVVEPHTLQENWKIVCIPTLGSRIDRLIVALTSNDEGTAQHSNLNWELIGDEERALKVQELSDTERSSLGLSPNTAVYEIRLTTSRSIPFEIGLTRISPIVFDKFFDIPLVFLPEIESQVARVDIRSLPSVTLEQQTDSLISIPVEPAAPDRQNRIAGAFRYQPVENREDISLKLRLTSKSPAELANAARCWYLRFDSLYDSRGTIRNHSKFYIENSGRDFGIFTLPAGIDSESVNAVWIDGERATWLPVVQGNRHAIHIAFPPDKKFIVVSIEYTFQENPLSGGGTIQPQIPEIDIPVLACTWGLWLPPQWCIEENIKEEHPEREHFVFDYLSERQMGNAKKMAEIFLDRLGEESAIRQLALHYPSRPTSGEMPLDSSARPADERTNWNGSGTRAGNIVTWEHLLTWSEAIKQLFQIAPEQAAPQIIIDRNALNNIRVLPTTKVTWGEAPTAKGKGLRTLEQTGIVLVFINEKTILVTNVAFCIANHRSLTPIAGDRFWFPKKKQYRKKLLQTVTDSRNTNFIPASFWKSDTVGAMSPWTPTSRGTQLLSEVPNWNIYELDPAMTGTVKVVNRYHTMNLKWFLFVLVLTLFIRRPGPRDWTPHILVVLIGLSGTLSNCFPPVYSYCIDGIYWGSVAALLIYIIRWFLIPREPTRDRSSVTSVTTIIPDDHSSEPGFVTIPAIHSSIPPSENNG